MWQLDKVGRRCGCAGPADRVAVAAHFKSWRRHPPAQLRRRARARRRGGVGCGSGLIPIYDLAVRKWDRDTFSATSRKRCGGEVPFDESSGWCPARYARADRRRMPRPLKNPDSCRGDGPVACGGRRAPASRTPSRRIGQPGMRARISCESVAARPAHARSRVSPAMHAAVDANPRARTPGTRGLPEELHSCGTRAVAAAMHELTARSSTRTANTDLRPNHLLPKRRGRASSAATPRSPCDAHARKSATPVTSPCR